MSQSALDNDSVMETDTVFCSGAISSASGSGKGRKNIFFQRSDSTLCLGCSPPDPFETPMIQALPLADQPHLLQPNSRKEDLFGFPKHNSAGGKYLLCFMIFIRLWRSQLVCFKREPKNVLRCYKFGYPGP